MRARGIGCMAAVLAVTLALAGCVSGRQQPTQTTSSGFAKGSLIGIALPAKTSENWVIAGDEFNKQLSAAGFTPDVQYASSDGTVADQQSQIQTMIINGAKAIV